jgi:sugar O-acyltransferase (sialic acid O-acetyltransferase NeuD family)
MGIVIVGAGGFGKEVFHYILDACAARGEPAKIRGFAGHLAPAPDMHTLAPYLGHEDKFAIEPDDVAVIAVGDPGGRRSLAERLTERGLRFCTIVHPTAYIAATASVAEGCIIAPFAFIGPSSVIGSHTAINTYASVGHDAAVGAYCTFSPYAVVNGRVELGEMVFLGTGATVTPRVRVGRCSRIAAGTVVSQDVPAGSLVASARPKSRVMFKVI